ADQRIRLCGAGALRSEPWRRAATYDEPCRRLGRAWNYSELPGAGVVSHRAEYRALSEPGMGQLPGGSYSSGSAGRAARSGRAGGVSGVGGEPVRDGADAAGGWRNVDGFDTGDGWGEKRQVRRGRIPPDSINREAKARSRCLHRLRERSVDARHAFAEQKA